MIDIGILRTKKTERMVGWVEHFKGVLIREESEHPAADEEIDMIKEVGEIDCNQFIKEKVMAALKKVKKDKSYGIENVSGDLLKVDMKKTSVRLTDLFNIMWQDETVSVKWKKGLIVKILKKGDMRDLTNGEE